MSCSFDDEGPAIVQLQKLCLQVNLADFHEGFLSPTREHILLLSYHHEGLLLPLVKGVKVDDQIISDPVDDTNSYPMLSDITSLAWGICDDSNNEALFRELLFVVGDHGLIVHAICQTNESFNIMPDGQNGEGIWVEWGPSTSTDAMTDDNAKNADTFVDLSENVEPRKWLKTFLTKVETVKFEGRFYTRFPDKSQLPSSSKVVSFNILENDSTLLRFILNDFDPQGDEMNMSNKCCRVFVNNSHDLIGFVLTLVFNEETERKQGKNVVVGKVVSWGIQWVCSVKLDEDVYMVPMDQWTDFKFLDKYLICLTSGGQIHFFVAITGAYMGCVNLLEILKLSYQTSDLVGKSVFRTLVVASRTSLLAVVDDYGIVYVTRATDLLSDINDTVEKSLPQFQQLKYRSLVGWEVGGADISHQRPNIDFFREQSFFKDKTENNERGFSAASRTVGQNTHSALRSIFLPTDKYSKDDIISLSPFGITRLYRNNNTTTKRMSRIIHFNLHIKSAMSDDKGSKEVSVADAVGCTFHGCFYLVTADSLSVVLPSISVSSGCIPVEAIGFRQINCCLTDQFLEIKGLKQPWPTWKMEVLDRVLLYEGHGEADLLCSENGWDLKVSRIRRLQLALDYLNFQEIEISLEMLAGVSLAEEGVLRLVFAAVYLMLNKGGNDTDVSAASRLLSLGTHFCTKMIRSYGSLQRMQNVGMKESSLPLLLADKEHNRTEISTRLQEMARLLEIIRNMQCRLATKFKKSVTRLGDGLKPLEIVDSELSQDEETTNEQLMESRSYSELESLRVEASFQGSRGENPKDMIARWELHHLDQKDVVKDALLSGRLPLAVLKLHLHNQQGRDASEELHDTFEKVRDIGRAIAYDLFLKGETELGVTTLQKLGEDLESCLKQLVFGTVRRSLRKQITQVMKIHGYLGPYESKILEGISFIERVYPCTSFSGAWQKTVNPPKLSLLHPLSDVQCGELDGVVLGLWRHVSKHPVIDDDDDTHHSYWTAAAVWSDAWDQRVIDRIVLDRVSVMDIDISWESQFEYHISHSKWEEASRLIDTIPSYSSSHGDLQISLDGLPTTSAGIKSEFSDYGYSIQDLDAVYMDVSDIKILRFPSINTSSMWLKSLVESQLAKKFIFLKEFWEGTEELVCLLARSGFVTNSSESTNESTDLSLTSFDNDTSNASFHKLFLHHCIQLNLPNLLDLYLDHHKLATDLQLLSALLEAAGDCEWAKWLVLSRVKGSEYEASFSNARAIASHNFSADDIIHTVDDIAEGAGEMAAVATLMYAPVPIQDCLSSGSVDRNRSSSAQCTLENLRPAVQRYPTLWRTLVAACFGQDPTASYTSSRSKVFGNSYLSDYLSWRDSFFYSAGLDTSLQQMLPGWFSKAVRRLVQLYVQGPLGWQSVPAEESFPLIDVDNGNEQVKITTMSWEAAIQRHVEELYGPSLEGSRPGLEHHLHRGRALSAFIHLLSLRVKMLKSEYESRRLHGQSNIQSDVHTLLSPITQDEESLLSSVMPLAVMHFEDSVLVASCAFLLELCGLSPIMLQVDIATLRRISSSKGSLEGDITGSMAQALAEYHLRNYNTKEKDNNNTKANQALMLVLHNLEKASLPSLVGGETSGSWLKSGNGDGADLRAQQKAASLHWSLVTEFCKMHQIPVSTKYLAVLAKDNDWVGFLSEAQVEGHPLDTVIQLASKEFSDPCLKLHITTVLKGMQSRKTSTNTNNNNNNNNNESCFLEDNNYIPVELFSIIADCEKQKNPGETLLLKAKDLCWSVLAMVASCFPDVSPLCCLTVWLEITAARETTSIKVNDIASQISSNVAAAVDANNLLPRSQTLHYNRRNPKRRRLMESDSSKGSSGYTSMFVDFLGGDSKDENKVSTSSDKVVDSLSKMVAVLCEQRLFLPLLRAFEMFLPSCSLLPFIRALQAFSQMRLSEASAHLGSFSARIKEEHTQTISLVSVAEKASDAMLMTCPSPYEKRCLLQLLSATDFGDGGSHYRRLYWKISLAEPLLRKDDVLHLGNNSLDDASLLTALETNGYWEQARSWSKQLEATGGPWKSAAHHVTETQAESMVAEWKEFLWDVPEERVALWGHCQMLFLRYAFPPIQAGLFFLKHAEAVDKDLPPKELHEMLLLSLQWLSGMITQSAPVYPLHLLRELETRVWLLAVESEAQVKSEGEKNSGVVDHTASIISKMDTHMNTMRVVEKSKRRSKVTVASRMEEENNLGSSRWEESIGPDELEKAVLSLLEFGQISAARQLQHKLSPSHFPSEFTLVDAALKLASISTPSNKVAISMLDEEVRSVIHSHNLPTDHQYVDPMQVLESLVSFLMDDRGRGLCKRLISVVKAANVLCLSFSEAFDKQPIELLQLLSLKAQDSFEEAYLLVQTHSMPAASIAQILAESFLKGLLAAHRGGYIDSQKEEGPAPLLWRFSDFLKWAELCPSESEIGHALMRLVITGQEIPHACEVELLILSHHFYKSSACLDGVDVLVALAATRVDTYVSEGDFSCLARLITGVGNFHALNFILGILIENGQLELLLHKYTGTAQAVRGFRMAVLTSLKQFNPNDLDAFAMVYNHFDMKHETAALLESRAEQSYHMWFLGHNKDHTQHLLESMRYFIEAAQVHSSIDAGNKTRAACARASLVSLQIRMPDFQWLALSDTNARRALVEQSRFQEALIVAEAYGLNQPAEWALVLWNQMLKPDLTEHFVAEFVAVLPLHPTMLAEIARFYRAEVAARGDQSQFSVWLTGGGLPAEWAKYLERSFRCLLRRTRDIRLKLQLATVATGFADVIAACLKALDRVPDNGAPLVLRKGHGGAYLPLM